MKRNDFKKEISTLLHPGSGRNEVRILVKGKVYKTLIVTADKGNDIDVTSKEAAEATIKLITNLNEKVEYFRDGKPLPITGVVIKTKGE